MDYRDIEPAVADLLIGTLIHGGYVEEGECWIWQKSTCNGYPTVKYARKNIYVRKAVLDLSGRKVPSGYKIASGCGNKLCIHPACLKVNTVSAVNRAAVKHGHRNNRARIAKIAHSKRKNSVLNMEKVREIRASTDTNLVLGARYGVNKSLISQIKTGKAWKELNSPWAGLL